MALSRHHHHQQQQQVGDTGGIGQHQQQHQQQVAGGGGTGGAGEGGAGWVSMDETRELYQQLVANLAHQFDYLEHERLALLREQHVRFTATHHLVTIHHHHHHHHHVTTSGPPTFGCTRTCMADGWWLMG
jgi:hypothetical protein